MLFFKGWLHDTLAAGLMIQDVETCFTCLETGDV